MILPSTIRKMQAKGQRVCRIVWPAHTVALNGTKLDFPERREYFATESGANNTIVNFQEMILQGFMPKPSVDFVDGIRLDVLTGKE